ncbi:hypothetical protein [Streptomyces thioluteus]|uniref:hypothetical protein n=1 Tax=Streptomyces thioluteus TaxID=66431 RepID=UPI0031E9DB01
MSQLDQLAPTRTRRRPPSGWSPWTSAAADRRPAPRRPTCCDGWPTAPGTSGRPPALLETP